VVVSVVFALYGHTLNFGFSYLDDDVLILDAQDALTRPSSLSRSFARPYFPPSGGDHAYYRPVVNASFALDAQRGGARPRIYRATNLVVHAVAAGLLLLFLRRLGYGAGVSLFGGLLLAVHPALTEAVAWIPGRNDSLLAVWTLTAWLFLSSARPPRRWGMRLGHLVAFLLALFTKETAVALPIAFLAYARLVEERSWPGLAAPWLLVGWVAAIGIYTGARAAALPEGLGLAGLSLDGFARLPSVLTGNLGKLVLPVHLSVLAIPEDTWRWPGLAAAGLLLAALFLPGIRRARLGFAVVCLMLFILPGAPASHLIVLENRLYLPAIAVVLAIAEVATALPVRSHWKVAGALALLIVFATRTLRYTDDFRDRMTFSLAAVRESPHSSLAQRNLGVAFHVQGDLENARRAYELALALDAGEPVAHNNLAVILMAHGQLAEAERQLQQELAINPGYRQAHRNLALLLRASGRADEAAAQWEASLGLGATDVEALSELIAHYAARDAARADRFRALRDASSDHSPAP
jgi:protein O-mannosyl-transferase